MGVVIYSLVVSCLPDRKGITHTPVRYNTGIGMITINHSHSGYAPTKGTASQRLARAIVDHCAAQTPLIAVGNVYSWGRYPGVGGCRACF